MSRLIQTIDEEGYITKYSYDKTSNLTSIEDPKKKTINYTYDNLDQRIEAENQEGNKVYFKYDSSGLLTEFTEEVGDQGDAVENVTTRYEYDKKSQLIKITNGLGKSKTFEYDKMGRIIKETDEKNNSETYRYDMVGNIIESLDKEQNKPVNKDYSCKYDYDKNGNLIHEIDAQDNERWFEYDSLDRVIKIKDEMHRITEIVYYKNGLIKETVERKESSRDDKDKIKTEYLYDGNQNLIATIKAKGTDSEVKINYHYDSMDRLVKIELPWIANGEDKGVQETVFKYDKRGLKVMEINAENLTKTYSYDGNRNLIKTLDEDNLVTEYEYGPANYLTKAKYSDGKSATLAYNKKGDLISVDDWNGKTTFALDELSRVKSVKDHNGKVTGYEWDEVGNKIEMIYPNGDSIKYEYNKNDWITKVTEGDNKETSYKYDNIGRVKEKHYPTGEVTTYTYNNKSELMEVKEQKNKSGSTRRHYKYDYDDEGNLKMEYSDGVGVDPKQRTVFYEYDDLHRLIETRYDDGSKKNYIYDSIGNIIQENNSGKITAFKYNALNQLTSKTEDQNSFTYSYDKRGNLIEEFKNGTSQKKYNFNSANRLEKGTSSNGDTSEYIYNGLGYRINNKQTLTSNPNKNYASGENSPGSLYVGSIEYLANLLRPEGEQKTYETNYGSTRQKRPAVLNKDYIIDYTDHRYRDIMVYEEGSHETQYTYGLDEKLSQTIKHITGKTDLENEGKNPGTSIAAGDISKVYVHQDNLGSTRYMTDVTGDVITHTSYDEWGKPTTPTILEENYAGLENLTEFTGHTYDIVMEKYFAQARFYDPSNMRFTSIDPMKDGTNWYEYCVSNPKTYIDEDGLAPKGKVHFALRQLGYKPTLSSKRMNSIIKRSMAPIIQRNIVNKMKKPVEYILGNKYMSTKNIQGKKHIQQRLNSYGYRGLDGKLLKVDGKFGANTTHALKKYQAINGLNVNGKVDSKTIKSLKKGDNGYNNIRKPIIAVRNHFATPKCTLKESFKDGFVQSFKGIPTDFYNALIQQAHFKNIQGTDPSAGMILLVYDIHTQYMNDSTLPFTEVVKQSIKNKPSSMDSLKKFQAQGSDAAYVILNAKNIYDDMDDNEKAEAAGYIVGEVVKAAVATKGAQTALKSDKFSKLSKGATKTVINTADDLVPNIRNWLGKDAKMITNKSGDKIFISSDGTKRVRFDINNPSPHSSPHGHVEELVNGKWVKSGPIYPNDVPQR